VVRGNRKNKQMNKDRLLMAAEWGRLKAFAKKVFSRKRRRHIEKTDKKDIKILVKFK